MRASFRVEIAGQAEADLRAIHDQIARDKPRAAGKWLRDTLAAIRSLRSLPYRHEVIPEAEELGIDRRHLIRGNYRILYRIEGQRVRVLRVIHAARRLTERLLQDEPP
jgi:plasmid stabilization system protein ParE